MEELLLGFYGDDFTGSVDAMETLSLHGVETALFLRPPTGEELRRRFPSLRAVGVAGVSRSLRVGEMEEEIRPAFEALRALAAPVFHYKTCSTFDSSPEVGNVGRAVEIALEVFGRRKAALVLGTPFLKRFVAFGNLFATLGEETYRIDRHPTMSRHPITPMQEGDVRLHMAKQTDLPVRLLDTLALRRPKEKLRAAFHDLMEEEGKGIVLFDTINDPELPLIGELLWERARKEGVLAVGSSGVEYALGSHWVESGQSKRDSREVFQDEADQLLVMSGSATAVTERQIERARSQGYAAVRLNGPALMQDESAVGECERVCEEALAALEEGRNVVLFATLGADDPAIEATKRAARAAGVTNASIRLGQWQGRILKELIDRSGLRRVCVAGGDTSGYACRALGIFALQVAAPLAPGSPLCRVSSDEQAYDGMTIALKAGQAGEEDYFEQVRKGGAEKAS